MVVHYGGSRSAVVYAEQLAREKGIHVQAATVDTFMQLHYKDMQYTSGRTRMRGEELHRRLTEVQATQGRDVTHAEVEEIFHEVNRRDKMGRRLGTRLLSQAVESSTSSVQSSDTSPVIQSALTAEVVELRNDLATSRSEQEAMKALLDEQARRQEESDRRYEEQRKQLEMMQKQMSTIMQLYAVQNRPTGFTPSDWTPLPNPDLADVFPENQLPPHLRRPPEQ